MSGKKLVRVDVVLENCEYYSFKAAGLSIYLDGYWKHCFGKTTYIGFNHIAIVIEDKVEVLNNGTYDKEDWQYRIDRDITQIELHYSDGTMERVFVDWCEDSDYENMFETDIKEPFRHIYIISRTKKRLEDF